MQASRINIKLLTITPLILFIGSCLAQSEIEDRIIAKWISVVEMDSLDSSINPFGDSYSKVELNTTIIFDTNDMVFINQNGNEYNANYSIKDSILTIGNRQYIIIEITNNKLIYKDKNGLLNKQYEFKRAK
ncbi:hypothetical protein [Croceibacter atlanticus]|uniref:hypothetical protein n=1 Tax=Croceibacter atlanticus TaxID=313588 RepID=UPI0030F91C00